MIIAVTGWRHWTDGVFIRNCLYETIDKYGVKYGVPLHVRVGDAGGADTFVRRWCQNNSDRVTFQVFYARWDIHGSHPGSPAGSIRNKEMLEGKDDTVTGPTELLLGFPSRRRPVRVPGSGSWGCMVEAALMGIRVEIPAYKDGQCK